MDAILCRQHVERLIGDEIGLLVKLQGLLDREFVFINGNDVDSLEEAGRIRQDCMGDLVRVEEERKSLCRMSGRGSDNAALADLLKWCDPAGALQSRLQECASQAARCRQLNDRNGMAVTARLKQVSGMLNLITGRQQPATYGKQTAYAAAPVGRMVSHEA